MSRIKIMPAPLKQKLSFSTSVFSIGSCFSDQLASYLYKNGITVYSNPHGTIYNPYSIKKALEDLATGKQYQEEDLIIHHKNFISLNHSASFDSENKEITLSKINSKLKEAEKGFYESELFIITLGTAVVYEYENNIAANCHRIPQTHFHRRMLEENEIVSICIQIIKIIHSQRPESPIVFTVSPIRHDLQNLRRNTISKARLHSALATIEQEQQIHYFPSYEILCDELRDYCYYKKDQIHPTNKAISIIMKRFVTAYFSPDAISQIEEIKKLRKMICHQPFFPASTQHLHIIKIIVSKIIPISKRGKVKVIEEIKKELFSRLIRYFPTNPSALSLIRQLFSDQPEMVNLGKELIDFQNGTLSLKQLSPKLYEDPFFYSLIEEEFRRQLFRLMEIEQKT